MKLFLFFIAGFASADFSPVMMKDVTLIRHYVTTYPIKTSQEWSYFDLAQKHKEATVEDMSTLSTFEFRCISQQLDNLNAALQESEIPLKIDGVIIKFYDLSKFRAFQKTRAKDDTFMLPSFYKKTPSLSHNDDGDQFITFEMYPSLAFVCVGTISAKALTDTFNILKKIP